MIINRVSLFDNRFKNYQKTNVNKEAISFSSKSSKLSDAVKETAEMARARISRGELTEKERRFLKGLEEARKKGELDPNPNAVEEDPPGMPRG